MSPAARQAMSVLEGRGAFKKNPGRRRVEPKVSGPIGEPPDYFTEEEKSAWREIVRIAPLDVLSVADSLVVELAARLMVMFRSKPVENFPVALVAQYRSCLGTLGMTPSDRSKVVPQEKQKDSVFAMYGNANR